MAISMELVTVGDSFTIRKENSIVSSDPKPGQEGAAFTGTGYRSQDSGVVGQLCLLGSV